MKNHSTYTVEVTNTEGELVQKFGPYQYKGVATRKWDEMAPFIAKTNHLFITIVEHAKTR